MSNFDAERLPLRLRQLHGGARQGVEIDGSLGCGCLPGKADQAGDQRFRAANILADLGGQGLLLRRERSAEQHVGISQHGGDGIVEFVGGAADQLADRSQFFRLQDLRLQTLEIVERFARMVEQVDQFAIQQMLADEDHHAHEECGDQSQSQAKHADARRDRVIGHGPGGEQGQRKHRNHAAAGDPNAVKRGNFAGVGGWLSACVRRPIQVSQAMEATMGIS